jgi:hypothetical protein
VLEDNDVLHMVGGGYGIYNTAQADVEAAVPRRLQLLDMEVDSIMKVCRAWQAAWYASCYVCSCGGLIRQRTRRFECRYCIHKHTQTSRQECKHASRFPLSWVRNLP